MKESLGVLEDRLKHALPDRYEEDIEEEFARFEIEVERMSRDEEKIGQATLTNKEVKRLKTTNQNGGRRDGLTVVQWQAVKGAALHYGVTDWTQKVDGKLTMEENIDLMRQKGTESGKTLREMKR